MKWFLGLWDEIRHRISSVLSTIKESLLRFWNGVGGWPRKVMDIGFGIGVAAVFPPVAVGFAAANFVDKSDVLGGVITACVAFVALEFLALWSLELIGVLAGLQVSRITIRYLQNVERRKLEYSTA